MAYVNLVNSSNHFWFLRMCLLNILCYKSGRNKDFDLGNRGSILGDCLVDEIVLEQRFSVHVFGFSLLISYVSFPSLPHEVGLTL